MAKAAEAFRTISEVADALEVPKHVLRFWEGRFLQLRPMKRGGGRRYYRPADVELLRGIRYLLYEEGYKIEGVQKLLREQGVESVKQHGLAEHASGEEGGEPARLGSLNGGGKRARAEASVGEELERALAALGEVKRWLRPSRR